LRDYFSTIFSKKIASHSRFFRSEPLRYEGLDQPIISAAVVPPKKDLFVDEVKHLLVLATPIEIVLLAVHVDVLGVMQLIDSPISYLSFYSRFSSYFM